MFKPELDKAVGALRKQDKEIVIIQTKTNKAQEILKDEKEKLNAITEQRKNLFKTVAENPDNIDQVGELDQNIAKQQSRVNLLIEACEALAGELIKAKHAAFNLELAAHTERRKHYKNIATKEADKALIEFKEHLFKSWYARCAADGHIRLHTYAQKLMLNINVDEATKYEIDKIIIKSTHLNDNERAALTDGKYDINRAIHREQRRATHDERATFQEKVDLLVKETDFPDHIVRDMLDRGLDPMAEHLKLAEKVKTKIDDLDQVRGSQGGLVSQVTIN